MTRFGYPWNLLFSLTLLQSFLVPVAWAGSSQSQNPLLGTWRVEPLSGDRSAQVLQCRTLAEIEFREKSIRMEPRKAVAEKGDDTQMSIAADLMGLTQHLSGQAQGAKVVRVSYEKDGDNWFVNSRDYDAPPIVLETRGANEMLMQDPHCILKRNANVSVKGEATATASPAITEKANARPVNLEKIVEGFGVITLADLRQTLKQKQANIVFDGAGRSPYSFSLVTRGMPGIPSAEFPVISYSFDASGRLRAFSGKRQIAEGTQMSGVAGVGAKLFNALVNDYSTRFKLIRRVSSADRKQASPNSKRFGGPETEMAEFEGSTVKLMLTRIDGVLNESFSHKSD